MNLRELPFRGKFRILNPLTPRRGTRTARVFGYEMSLNLQKWEDRLIYMGCYEQLNSHRFKAVLRPGMVVCDVGANIGYYSLLSSRLVGKSGRVYSFEPAPENFKILSATLQRNGVTQCEALACALGAETGTAHVEMSRLEGVETRTASTLPSGTGPGVPMTSLDEFIRSRGITRIDLLKIDVDGFESKIIQGATHALKSGVVRHLLIEFNAYWLKESGTTPDGLNRLITSYGFENVSRGDKWPSLLLGPSEDQFFRSTVTHP